MVRVLISKLTGANNCCNIIVGTVMDPNSTMTTVTEPALISSTVDIIQVIGWLTTAVMTYQRIRCWE